VLKIDKATPGW